LRLVALVESHFAPSQRGAPTRSPRLLGIRTRYPNERHNFFSATAFLRTNGWPCKARTNASSLLPLHLNKERHAAVLQRGAFVQVAILRTDEQRKKRGNL